MLPGIGRKKGKKQVFGMNEWVRVCDYIYDRNGECLVYKMGKVIGDCSFLCHGANAYRVRWAGTAENEIVYACHLERVL